MFIHVLLGSIIGLNINSAALIILLGVVSHFILDWIPHWDSDYDKKEFNLTGKLRTNKRGIILIVSDLALMILFAYLITRDLHQDKMVLVGILASIAPDIAKIGYPTRLRKKGWYMRYLKFHSKIQKEVSWKSGLLIQAVIFIALLLFL